MKTFSIVLLAALVSSTSFAGVCKYTEYASKRDSTGKSGSPSLDEVAITHVSLQNCVATAQAQIGQIKGFKRLTGTQSRPVSSVYLNYNDDSVKVSAEITDVKIAK